MPAEPAAPGPPKPNPVALDTGTMPLGEGSLRQILNHVLAVGDEAETTYLEIKSNLDLGSKAGVAKVAQFPLGVATAGYRRQHTTSAAMR